MFCLSELFLIINTVSCGEDPCIEEESDVTAITLPHSFTVTVSFIQQTILSAGNFLNFQFNSLVSLSPPVGIQPLS